MRKNLQHHLISLPLDTKGSYAHTYLMCDNERIVERAAGEMLDHLEHEMGVRVMVPMFMDTKLTPAATKKLRRYVNEICPESIETMKQATTLHRTMWIAPVGSNPQWLLDLH